jgi:hypothetical protein
MWRAHFAVTEEVKNKSHKKVVKPFGFINIYTSHPNRYNEKRAYRCNPRDRSKD